MNFARLEKRKAPVKRKKEEDPDPLPQSSDQPAIFEEPEPLAERYIISRGVKKGITATGREIDVKKDPVLTKTKVRKQLMEAKRSLPLQILPISNADKDWHERWSAGRDWLNIPHPFRAVLMGPPNSGKTTVVKNLLMRADPPFTRLVVIYPDGGGFTDEYEDCGEVEMIGHIPPPEAWDGKEKTLCVVDDFELKSLSKSQRSNLDRLVGHVSTHRNVSVCICNQDAYNAPPIVRRCANLFILWKPKDIVSMQTFASRTGEDLRALFASTKSRFDSIWIDMTVDSPCPRRLNGYECI